MQAKYLDFLYGLGIFNIKFGLKNIRSILKKLDDPHRHPRIIHIAGTNGKGSTLAVLERLLFDSGYSTGSTISPHLISFNERFRVNGIQAKDQALNRAFQRVRQACGIDADLSLRSIQKAKIKPTFFEYSIAMAFAIFQECKVDFILLETGLGGRLDATNVVENPLVCILTRIAIDHQEYLGDTIESITAEKLGILKNNAQVFVAPQEERVLRQIRNKCREKEVQCVFSPKHFSFFPGNGSMNTEYHFQSIFPKSLNMSKPSRVITIDNPGLVGDHQRENFATAMAAYFAMVPANNQLEDEQINTSLQNLKWPGRLEYFGENGSILLDGAHNVSGMTGLLEYLRSKHGSERIIFAISWMNTKRMLPAFEVFSNSRIAFQPIQMKTDESVRGEDVFNALEEKKHEVFPSIDVETLVDNIKSGSLADFDLLVISGSLRLLGEFLEEWKLR